MSTRPIDLSFAVYDHVLVLERTGFRYPGGDNQWACLCKRCGKSFVARGKDLRRGDYRSCGCLSKSRSGMLNPNARHGDHGSPLYMKWKGMRKRCASDPDYVKRGIRVCADWNSFSNFKRDMSPSFVEGLTLERNDPHGEYCRDNCRWIPMNEQSRNRTNSIKIMYKGREEFLWKVAELEGFKRSTLWARYWKGSRGADLLRPYGKRKERTRQ